MIKRLTRADQAGVEVLIKSFTDADLAADNH